MSKLVDNLDIVVFALVVGASGWLVASGTGTARKAHDAAVARADEAAGAVKAALAEDRYAADDGSRILDELQRVPAEVERQWAPPVRAAELPPGLFYHPQSLEDLRSGAELELRFRPPENVVATAEVGSIQLAWSPNERNTVHITGYAIFRTGPDRVETKIATLDSDATDYGDEAVEAGALYSYRVAAVTDEEVLVAKGRTESDRSAPVTVRGRRDYEVEAVAYREADEVVRVRVRKFHEGVWYDKEFDARVGEEIGARDPGSGVDYGTRCHVADISEREDKVPETRDEVTFDETGRVLLVDGAPVTTTVTYERKRRVIVLTFKNEVGENERIELHL